METTPIKALTEYKKVIINDLLEMLAVLQVTHGERDEEWFIGYRRNGDPEPSSYYLCTGRRSR